MDKAFLKKMKEYLLEQRKTLLASLADQGEDMRNLIKTVESGDEADVAADVIELCLQLLVLRMLIDFSRLTVPLTVLIRELMVAV